MVSFLGGCSWFVFRGVWESGDLCIGLGLGKRAFVVFHGFGSVGKVLVGMCEAEADSYSLAN